MKNNYDWSLDQDFEDICNQSNLNFRLLDGSNLFITGGTGFIGIWLLKSLKFAIENLNLNIEATILTRSINQFKLKSPELLNFKNFNFYEGDILNSIFPEKNFTHIIHAATDASAALNENNPKLMFDTVVQGTQNILDFAVKMKTKKVLFLSSGAIYGRQPWEMRNVCEDWNGDVNCIDPKLTYAEAKRAAEMLCSIYGKQFGLNVSIARIFALLGPYLSLDIHFAAGNFILDAMRGKEILVQGNGKPCRSYLYALDLIVWLWHLLVHGEKSEPYNLGSDEVVSIRELAEKVSNLLGGGGYKILNLEDKGWNVGRYVPSISKIYNNHGLKRTVTLDESILRTALWNGWKG